jgi:myo-inositol-1(or 4)-monophosphatase
MTKPSPEELDNICRLTIELVRTTCEFLLTENQKFSLEDVEYKGMNDLVSYVDKEAEKMVVSACKKILPGAGFITEEGTVQSAAEESKLVWIIDPLDGTTNFIHSLPVFSVSIGLMQNNELILGVVYECNRDEMFYAWKGSKAFLNNQIIHVKQNPDLSKSLLATGFPYYDFEVMENYLATLKYLMVNTQGMRRMGSAAVDLAYSAWGRFDGFFEYGLHPWDVAGGAFIVQQAGGKLSTFDGNDNYIFSKTLIASSSILYPSFFEVIKKNF